MYVKITPGSTTSKVTIVISCFISSNEKGTRTKKTLKSGIWTSSCIPFKRPQSCYREPDVKYCTIEFTIVTVVELSPKLFMFLSVVSALVE